MSRAALSLWRYGALVNWLLCTFLFVVRTTIGKPTFEVEVRGLLWFLVYAVLDWRLTSEEGPGHGR